MKLGVLAQYQIDRFAAFADPTRDPLGAGYNVKQARIAIGSGGLIGKGLFHGTQTNGKFVPEQQTDFVFTVAGEELGFVGAGLLIVLLGIVLWRAMRIADARRGPVRHAGGHRHRLLVHLPGVREHRDDAGHHAGDRACRCRFVSYGGSSMFATLMAVGLLQNVHMRRYA